ncbi:hypothetical protein V6S75_33080, partial [Burkholderia pseudomallei]|uniref:hypothetical protein n=1 Tax=Burkholderia pseudomallei TaxID=28450 RepID=UPI0034585001
EVFDTDLNMEVPKLEARMDESSAPKNCEEAVMDQLSSSNVQQIAINTNSLLNTRGKVFVFS